MDKQISLLKFPKICRVCLNEKANMKPIFEACVPNMIRSCATIMLQNDDELPKQICIQCLQQVNRSFTFKELCQRSDAILRQVLAQSRQLKAIIKGSDHFVGEMAEQCPKTQIKSLCLNLEENVMPETVELVQLPTVNNYEHETGSSEQSNLTFQSLTEECLVTEPWEQNKGIEIHQEDSRITNNENELMNDDNITEINLEQNLLSCSICNKTFKVKWKLMAHMRGHTGLGVHECQICGKRCSIPSLLKKHMGVHAAGRNQQIQERRRMKDKPHICSVCQKGFLDVHSLRKHTKEQHFGEKRIYEKKHMCNVCGKKFCNGSWLEIHMRKHTGERPLTCETCGKTFAMPSSLSKHMLTHMEKRHKCSECGKAFTQTFQLTVHMRTHTGERPYVCRVCGKGTTTSEALTVHSRTHSGEKPFACNQCDNAFASRSQLTIHMRRHTGQKPYSCMHCGRAFLQKGDLDTHIRYHTGQRPYACKLCPKRYFAHSALRVHMMGHTGLKPHQCSLCLKRFVSSHILKTHTRTHTGERPYSCHVCGHRFSQSGALSTHMKGHKQT